jgi:hypothetical protein
MRNKITRKIVHQKLIGYIFNPENKVGWAKGQWFIRALGFDPSQPNHMHLLEKQIAYNNNRAVFTHHTIWGPRFTQKLTVTGPNGKIIDGITIIWQRDKNTKTIRLITMHPPK